MARPTAEMAPTSTTPWSRSAARRRWRPFDSGTDVEQLRRDARRGSHCVVLGPADVAGEVVDSLVHGEDAAGEAAVGESRGGDAVRLGDHDLAAREGVGARRHP